MTTLIAVTSEVAAAVGMPSKVHTEFHDCPICDGKGTVLSRLPYRTKPCDQCGGRGVVTPIRRQQLLAWRKAKVGNRRDHDGSASGIWSRAAWAVMRPTALF